MKDTVNIGVIGISGRGSCSTAMVCAYPRSAIYIRTEPKGAPR